MLDMLGALVRFGILGVLGATVFAAIGSLIGVFFGAAAHFALLGFLGWYALGILKCLVMVIFGIVVYFLSDEWNQGPDNKIDSDDWAFLGFCLAANLLWGPVPFVFCSIC